MLVKSLPDNLFTDFKQDNGPAAAYGESAAEDEEYSGSDFSDADSLLDFFTGASRKPGDIRLMAIKPAKYFEEPVRFELDVVSLDDRPEYYTFSYAWGPSLEDGSHLTDTVVCGTRGMKVTRHLNTGLKRTRKLLPEPPNALKNGRMMLWVDAICLNQNDMVERYRQVRMMGPIYEEGYAVIVWLGEQAISNTPGKLHDSELTHSQPLWFRKKMTHSDK